MKFVTKVHLVILFLFQVVFAQQQIDNSKVALLMSSEESFLSKENEKQILEQITAWELMLMDNKVNYAVITIDDIDDLSSGNYDCLVIATDLYFDEDEWLAFQEYANESGMLLITAQIQVTGSDIKLTNREAIQKLTGFASISSEQISVKNLTQVITGQNQLTQNIEHGNKILLSSNKKIFFLDNLTTNQHSVGYLENLSEISGHTVDAQSAIIYGNNGKTKFAWYGFDHTNIIGGEADNKTFTKLLLNSIDWLKEKQYTAIGQWQNGLNSAFIFSPVINGRIDLTEKLISLLTNLKITADFLVSENAVSDTALLQKISEYGNFGLIVNDLEKNTNSVFDLLSELKKNTGKEIEYIATDNFQSVINLKKQLSGSGIKVIILTNYQKSQLPFYLDNEDKILIIPATYSSVRDEKDLLSFKINNVLYDDMYRDAINYQILDAAFCEDVIEKGISAYLAEINSRVSDKNILMTSPRIVYDWYEKKSNVSIRINSIDGVNYEIELRNGNSISVENLVFIIADSWLDTEPLLYENGKLCNLNFVYDKLENQIKLFVDFLKPYETRKIKITLFDNL